MPQTVNINGVAISYPVIGDTEWGVEATKFAELVGIVLQKIGQGNQSTTNNIVIGSISSPGNLTVASGDLSVSGNTTLTGNLTANGNTTLGNANTDTITVTGILNVDSGTLYVNPTDNRVGINDSSPSEALDVTGNVAVSGSITGTSATLTDLTVDTNVIKTDSTNKRVGINTSTPTEALDVTGNVKQSGILFNSNGTALAPSISFTSDTNTGFYRIGSDNIGIAIGGAKVSEFNSNGILGLDNILIIEDVKTSGTNGGTFTSGDWRTRDLNTIRVNRISGASLASNQISLNSGTYRIYASAPAGSVGLHKIRIQNITSSTTLLIGSSERTDNTDTVFTRSICYGEFTLSATSIIQLEHRCTINVASVGFGSASSFSVSEVYSQVFIQRVA